MHVTSGVFSLQDHSHSTWTKIYVGGLIFLYQKFTQRQMSASVCIYICILESHSRYMVYTFTDGRIERDVMYTNLGDSYRTWSKRASEDKSMSKGYTSSISAFILPSTPPFPSPLPDNILVEQRMFIENKSSRCAYYKVLGEHRRILLYVKDLHFSISATVCANLSSNLTYSILIGHHIFVE